MKNKEEKRELNPNFNRFKMAKTISQQLQTNVSGSAINRVENFPIRYIDYECEYRTSACNKMRFSDDKWITVDHIETQLLNWRRKE